MTFAIPHLVSISMLKILANPMFFTKFMEILGSIHCQYYSDPVDKRVCCLMESLHGLNQCNCFLCLYCCLPCSLLSLKSIMPRHYHNYTSKFSGHYYYFHNNRNFNVFTQIHRVLLCRGNILQVLNFANFVKLKKLYGSHLIIDRFANF